MNFNKLPFCAFFLYSACPYAKEAISLKHAVDYLNDFELYQDGSVKKKSELWMEPKLSEDGKITSKLYEKKSPDNRLKYGVEVRTSKETGLKSVMSYFGKARPSMEETVSYVAFNDGGKVASNTICWDKRFCVTLNDKVCNQLMKRVAATSMKDLAQKQAVCHSLSQEFDDIFKSDKALLPEVLKTQNSNYSIMVSSQISRSLNPSLRDLSASLKKELAPLPEPSARGQMQIAQALQACDHYTSTQQFEASKTQTSSSVLKNDR